MRVPAALCAVVGFKPSHGLWPLSGVLPLCPSLDSLGLLARSVRDVQLAHDTLNQALGLPVQAKPANGQQTVQNLRLGIASREGVDHDPLILDGFQEATRRLIEQGASLTPLEWPTLSEQAIVDDLFSTLVPLDLLATLGRTRLESGFSLLDPVSQHRLSNAQRSRRGECSALIAMGKTMAEEARVRVQGLDAVLKPTSPLLPVPVDTLPNVEQSVAFVRRSLANSRIGNVYNQCAITIPLRVPGLPLPMGLEIACSAREEGALLSIAVQIEQTLSAQHYPLPGPANWA